MTRYPFETSRPGLMTVTFLVIGLVFWNFQSLCFAERRGTRWWQREEMKPSATQVLNPTYLGKKRQLERAWDQYIENFRQEARFRSMGQKTSALKGAVRDSHRIVLELEEELAKIPIYVTKGSNQQNITDSTGSAYFYRPKVSNYPIYSKFDPGKSSYKEMIRVRCHPFPYVQDPGGYDLGSYEQLGEVSAYVIRVYPGPLINETITKRKKLSEAFPGIPAFLHSRGYASVGVRTPKQLLDPRNIDNLLEGFGDNKPLEIVIFGEQLPEYVDIPVPHGTYYLEYSLIFLNAKKSNHKRVHPNYPGRHASLKGLHDVCWGSPKILIDRNVIAEVDFFPSMNINFGNYPALPTEGSWEGSQTFREWLDYLEWTGEWPAD